jgi:farnesyl diphosphate synthase
MTFQSELDRIAVRMERHLTALLRSRLAQADDARLGEATAYALLGGGKRLRPFLLIKSAGLFGVAEEQALNAAAALECVHCYSLVHDDLPAMDDDALRRGRPTVHVAFDEATAILVGDGLLTLAFEIMSEPATHPDPAVRVALIEGLARAAGTRGMVGGQALDLAAEGRRLDADEISLMQSLKTGALFGFACDAGALLGGATSEQRVAIGRYAASLGKAFQLADDLLDEEGDEATTGKAVAKDAERGKATLVGLLGRDGAHRRLESLVAGTEAALASFGDRASELAALARFIAHRDS